MVLVVLVLMLVVLMMLALGVSVNLYCVPPPDQASADNARVVGLMAGKFADRGAEFALKQDQLTPSGAPPFPSPSVSNTQRRSFSTLGCIGREGGSPLPPGARRSVSSNERGVPIGLMTGDTGDFPPKLGDLRKKLLDFMEEVVYPAEHTLADHQMSPDRWEPHPLVEDMKVWLLTLQILLLLYSCSV